MCAGEGTSVSSRLSGTHPTILEGLATGRPMIHRYPSLYFCFYFLVNRASFLVRVRHFALMLDLKMSWTSPAVAMYRTNWYKMFFPCLVNRVFSDHPGALIDIYIYIYIYIRVLRRVFQVMGLQASHRVSAQSR